MNNVVVVVVVNSVVIREQRLLNIPADLKFDWNSASKRVKVQVSRWFAAFRADYFWLILSVVLDKVTSCYCCYPVWSGFLFVCLLLLFMVLAFKSLPLQV